MPVSCFRVSGSVLRRSDCSPKESTEPPHLPYPIPQRKLWSMSLLVPVAAEHYLVVRSSSGWALLRHAVSSRVDIEGVLVGLL